MFEGKYSSHSADNVLVTETGNNLGCSSESSEQSLFLFHFSRFPLGSGFLSKMLTTLIEYETPKVVTVHNVSIGKLMSSKRNQ